LASSLYLSTILILLGPFVGGISNYARLSEPPRDVTVTLRVFPCLVTPVADDVLNGRL
jgi:hypothetical protein